MNLELTEAGLLPVNVKFSDRQRYYDCFDCYFGNTRDAEPLTKLIADETAELEKRIAIIENAATL